MMQQLSNDTVIVSTQFSIWESQLPILLANKCCALEDLYLQYAVERISPSTTGETSAIDTWHAYHCNLSEEHVSSSLPLISKAASEGNFRLQAVFPASQFHKTHYLMIRQMPFEIDRVFVTHSAMPQTYICLACSTAVM